MSGWESFNHHDDQNRNQPWGFKPGLIYFKPGFLLLDDNDNYSTNGILHTQPVGLQKKVWVNNSSPLNQIVLPASEKLL